jgi:hypothetical protein
MRTFLLLLIFACPTALLAAQSGAQDRPGELELSGGLQLNEPGLSQRLGYTRAVREKGAIFWGAFLDWQVYSVAVGPSLSFKTEPRWLDLRADFALEPGYFIRADGTQEVGGGLRRSEDREPGLRALVRLQSNMNLRFDRFWIYGRTTAWYRYRGFREADTFLGITQRQELGLEHASAVMVRAGDSVFLGTPWIYAEYTHGVLRGHTPRPSRLSAGVVSEGVLVDQLTVNIDFFYSFADQPLDGLGLIVAYWFRFW